ncbi:MAG: gamma-glutamyltransferase [bacterium]|nr:gamma-glutamyltransferase [bacterium]
MRRLKHIAAARHGAVAVAFLLLASCAGERASSRRAEPTEAPAGDVTARTEVARSRQGMVVAGHPEAAEIGLAVLRAGGNAMDAAVAVSLALGVAEPYGSGLGGKLMFLYFDRASDQVYAIDAMDQSSSTLDAAGFATRGYEERSEGWVAVAVPGLLAGMYEGHRRWGRRPWAEVVRPAADLARSGARVLPQTRELFERRVERIRVSEEAARIFLPGGELPVVGDRLVNPDLGRTLDAIGREGPAGFYRGPVAEAIAAASREGGGSLTLDDLAGYEARVIEPLAVDFAGVSVLTAPPPASGGATLLAVLSRLADTEWSAPDLLAPDHLDLIGQVLQRTYPEIQARIADVPSARESFQELIDTRPSLARQSASPTAAPRSASSASTTHFVVADSDGNVASVTQSLSHHFGAGVVAPGTGVVLNNSMKNFATRDEGSVNYVAPGKRPRSTIAPTLVFRDGRPVLVIGLPGGQRIPTATLQVLLDYLVFQTDLAAAIGKPRAHLKRPLRETEASNVFELEADDAGLAAALEERGWAIEVSEDNETFGGFCAIEILEDGMLVGVADLRRTNAARGN